MLNFQNFFEACLGVWVTERTYHAMVQNEVERSHTEFRVTPLTTTDKETILSVGVLSTETTQGITIDTAAIAQDPLTCPGFAIAFDTLSEKGEQVSMQLKALFVPAAYVVPPASGIKPLPLPAAAEIDLIASGDVVQGLYLRDEGYSEAGATAGQFTYQPTRQTLEMTTYYKQSVAVDQMRFIAPDLRLRTIVTYRRPPAGEQPTAITLVGFGVERKQA